MEKPAYMVKERTWKLWKTSISGQNWTHAPESLKEYATPWFCSTLSHHGQVDYGSHFMPGSSYGGHSSGAHICLTRTCVSLWVNVEAFTCPLQFRLQLNTAAMQSVYWKDEGWWTIWILHSKVSGAKNKIMHDPMLAPASSVNHPNVISNWILANSVIFLLWRTMC